MQLGADEPDRNDAVLLCGAKQPEACAIARRLVLEEDLVESRERVPYVGGVVYREVALPLGIDICERAVGKLCARSRVQPRHRQMMARASPARPKPPPAGPTSTNTSEGVGVPRTSSIPRARMRAPIDNGVDLDNEEQGAGIWTCASTDEEWSALWPRLRSLNP